MIYVSFGLEKAGSTLTALLTREILTAAGHPHIALSPQDRADINPANGLYSRHGLQTNNVNAWTRDVVDAIDRRVPEGQIVMVRTHAPPCGEILDLVAAGRARCHVAVRDLRDVALSMLDRQDRFAKARRAGKTGIEHGNVRSTFDEIGKNLASLDLWAEAAGALALDYEETAFLPAVTIGKIARHLDLGLDESTYGEIFARAAAEPRGKLNVGQPRRHEREMRMEEQASVLAQFRAFYERYYPSAVVRSTVRD